MGIGERSSQRGFAMESERDEEDGAHVVVSAEASQQFYVVIPQGMRIERDPGIRE